MNIKRPAIGFYANDKTSKESGKITIPLSTVRALIFLDAFWSWEYSERQAFILHLFFAFIWATTNHLVSTSQFHHATVTALASFMASLVWIGSYLWIGTLGIAVHGSLNSKATKLKPLSENCKI